MKPPVAAPAPQGLAAFVPRKAEFARLVSLALPVAAVQVGLVFQGIVDTAMVGRVSAPDLAAVALGNLYFFGISVFGMGMLMALDPIVSQAFGAQDRRGIELAIQRGLVLGLGLALAASLLLALAGPVLRLLNQPPEVVPIAARYSRALAAGMIPFYGFVVYRQTLQALGTVAPVLLAVVAGNLLNVAANWVLIFGNLGVPAMGAVGSGWATAASRWFMFGVILWLGRKTLRPYLRGFRPEVLGDRRRLVAMVRLGAPIGLHMFLEFGAFGAIGIAMGWLGTVPMAGHQIALNLAAMTFMLAVGVAQAAAVRVGKSVGEGDAPLARRFAGAAVVVCCVVMSFTAAFFLSLPGVLANLFTEAAPVAAVAAALIPVAGVFQLFDGLQVVCAGALRGVADTLRPLVYNLLAFWLLGLPASLFLGFRAGMGPVGLWWGLAAALGIVAVLLVGRLWRRFHRPMTRFGAAAA